MTKIVSKIATVRNDSDRGLYEFLGYFVIDGEEIKEPKFSETYYTIYHLKTWQEKIEHLENLDKDYHSEFAVFYSKLKAGICTFSEVGNLEEFAELYSTLAVRVLLAQYYGYFKSYFMRGYDLLQELIKEYEDEEEILARLLCITALYVKKQGNELLNFDRFRYLSMSYRLRPALETIYELGLYYYELEDTVNALYYFRQIKDNSFYQERVMIKIIECLMLQKEFAKAYSYCEKVKTPYSYQLKKKCLAYLGVEE